MQQFDHIETLKIDLTRNLTTISSIGSNAPYVGLLGTVLGILVTFYTMGQGGKIEVNAIMLGLALALKATAAGLVGGDSGDHVLQRFAAQSGSADRPLAGAAGWEKRMKRFDQINMIPFIDIMLVLLAIVLTTASFISQGLIPVDLPKAEQSEQANGDEKVLEIAINAQNQIFLDGTPITVAELGGKLEAHPNTTPVQLRVDKVAAFEHFISVVDVLKAKQFAASVHPDRASAVKCHLTGFGISALLHAAVLLAALPLLLWQDKLGLPEDQPVTVVACPISTCATARAGSTSSQ